jgi:hypothetical protein
MSTAQRFRGKANPAAIIHMVPGKIVSGIRKHVFGKIMLNQLNAPVPASIGPKMTIHFGKTFMNAAGMHTPAVSGRGCKYSCSFLPIGC